MGLPNCDLRVGARKGHQLYYGRTEPDKGSGNTTGNHNPNRNRRTLIVDAVAIDGTPVKIDSKYGCSTGCGNEYNIIVNDVDNANTMMLCMPCFIVFATDVAKAMTDPDDPDVAAAVAELGNNETTPVGTRGRKNKRSDPEGIDAGSDFLDAFEDDVSEA